MASLKEVVKDTYDTIVAGIAWVVIYKEGRGWQSASFWAESGDYDAATMMTVTPFQRKTRQSFAAFPR